MEEEDENKENDRRDLSYYLEGEQAEKALELLDKAIAKCGLDASEVFAEK